MKNENFVVGVTGINPADTKTLLKADVSFTLNELGSEVAKHSSDVILRNDSLKSVVAGIMWGRNLFNNVKKYLQFYLIFVFVLLFTVLLETLIHGNIPFNLFELLWLIIIVDFIAIFVLTCDKPSSATLLENIVKYDNQLLTAPILRTIIMLGVYEVIVLVTLQHTLSFIFTQNTTLGNSWEEENMISETIIFQIFFYFII